MNYESSEKLKSIPLYVKAKLRIIDLIKNGAFSDNKLPSEKDLSDKLGISRATIREALMALHREGIISKKQGLGTLYHPSTLNSKMRIDKIGNFVELLKDGGYQVTVNRMKLIWTDDISDMELPEDTVCEGKYVRSEVIHSADTEAAIFSASVIPESILSGSYFDLENESKRPPTNSLNNFLNAYSKEEVSHSISTFKPINIDEEYARIFNLESGIAVIGWNEIYYGIMDNILCYTRIIFNPKLIDFSMLRKWD